MPVPAMGNRQQMAEINQFSTGVRPSPSMRPKSRNKTNPNRQRSAPPMPRMAATTRQTVSESDRGTEGAATGAGAWGSLVGPVGGLTEGRGAPHSPQKTSSLWRTAPQLSHWIERVIFPLSPSVVGGMRVPPLAGGLQRDARPGDEEAANLAVLRAKAVLVHFIASQKVEFAPS